MDNVGQILTAIQAHGFASDTAVVQRTLVNMGHKEICAKRRWSWLEIVGTLTTAANDATVATSGLANLRAATELDAVSVEESSNQYEVPLEYISPEEMRYRQQQYGVNLPAAAQQVGIPQAWAVSAGELQLWPIPDAVYTLNVAGLRSATTLDDDNDVPLIPVDHRVVLVHYAVKQLAARTRDWDLRNDAAAGYAETLRALHSAEGKRQRSNAGRIRESGFHGAAEIGAEWEY